MYDTNKNIYAWGCFSCEASNVQSQLVKLFQVKRAQMWSWAESEESVKQLIAERKTTRDKACRETKLKMQSLVKTDKKHVSYRDFFFKKRVKVCGLHWDKDTRKGNISLQTGKLVCFDFGVFDWEADWQLCHFLPSILLLIIYLSSKYTCNIEKSTLFEIVDLLNPFSFFFFFLLQLYKLFLFKHMFGVSFTSDAEKTFTNINRLIKIFVHFCTDSNTVKGSRILETLILQ